MNTLPKVAIVIVTYNRKDLLLECLESLSHQTYTEKEIYVIDNDSTDGTRDVLKQNTNKNNLHYFNTGSNIGGAGGFNYGLKLVAKTDCDYIWVMDDDTIPCESALEELVKTSKDLDNDFGFLSSYVTYPDGTYCKMNRQLVMEREWIEDYQWIKRGLLRLKRASFVSLFLKKKTIYKVGLPFKEFYIWGDDVEYTMRISSKFPCYFVADSIVVHKIRDNVPSTDETFLTESGERLDRYYYNYRNWFYISKTYDGVKGILREVKEFVSLQYKVITKSHGLKLRKLGIIWRAFAAGIFFNPKVEYPNDVKC